MLCQFEVNRSFRIGNTVFFKNKNNILFEKRVLFCKKYYFEEVLYVRVFLFKYIGFF